MTQETNQLLDQAIAAHQQGDWEKAEQLYRDCQQQSPDDNIVYLLGTLLLQQERYDQAIPLLKDVVNKHPESYEAQNNLAIAYQSLDEWDLAIQSFQAAIKANPKYTQGFRNFGHLLRDRGMIADAEKCYRHALSLDPQDHTLRWNLAQCLSQLGQYSEAEEHLQALLKTNPSQLEFLINLAFVSAQQGKYPEAIAICQNILTHKPDYPEIQSNLCYLYEHQGEFDQAIHHGKQAVSLKENYADAFNNLGIAYRSMHLLDPAVSAFERAIAIQPEFPLAEFNLGTTWLAREDYERGWKHYEARQHLMPSSHQHPFPRWEGQNIAGQRLLVTVDQGFGDTIQFVRFLPRLKQLTQAHIILACQPQLITILASSHLADEVVSEESSSMEAHFQVSLASLGQRLSIRDEQIRFSEPYLTIENQADNPFSSSLLSIPSDHKVVGFCWRGNPNQDRDYVRSMSLEMMLPVMRRDQLTAASFQSDINDDEFQKATGDLLNWGNQFSSFKDTAVALKQLDLLITVDTALAHLAGAMQIPTWVLLPHSPDWRWLFEGDETPWYPDLKLYRQPTFGDWESALDQIQQDLMSIKN